MGESVEFKIIIKPPIARTLLQKGNPILDIKPNKDKPNETVFVFQNTKKLREDLTAITDK